MSSTRSGINLSVIILSLINFLIVRPSEKKETHDYTRLTCGHDYVFDPAREGDLTNIYMTAQGKGVKRGDYIVLQNGSCHEKYQVEEIDYYSEPSNMWMALLRKVTANS